MHFSISLHAYLCIGLDICQIKLAGQHLKYSEMLDIIIVFHAKYMTHQGYKALWLE